jgi:penicillin-binding protein-related factor A (putative recombinase)
LLTNNNKKKEEVSSKILMFKGKGYLIQIISQPQVDFLEIVKIMEIMVVYFQI